MALKVCQVTAFINTLNLASKSPVAVIRKVFFVLEFCKVILKLSANVSKMYKIIMYFGIYKGLKN